MKLSVPLPGAELREQVAEALLMQGTMNALRGGTDQPRPFSLEPVMSIDIIAMGPFVLHTEN